MVLLPRPHSRCFQCWNPIWKIETLHLGGQVVFFLLRCTMSYPHLVRCSALGKVNPGFLNTCAVWDSFK